MAGVRTAEAGKDAAHPYSGLRHRYRVRRSDGPGGSEGADRRDDRQAAAVPVALRLSGRFAAGGAREIFKRCIFMLREHGMERVAVVSDSAIAALQAKRLGKETDTLLWSRYISTATHPDLA